VFSIGAGDADGGEHPMRFLTALTIVVALGGSAYAQGLPPIGIPMGEEKPAKPVDPVKENEYRSAIGGLPAPKSADPWGSVRESKPAPAAKKPAADKTKKNPATAKTTDAPKKTN
jgi:hypothetical protein